MNSFKSVLVPINRAGWPFIAIFAVGSLAVGWAVEPLGWLGAVLTAWCAYFFRDPDRVTPGRRGLLISPADGRISAIEPANPPPELAMDDRPRTRVSIFMNVFNVHVNRSPVDATVTKVAYHKGKFFNAELDKASEHNERMSLHLETDEGPDIAVVQIAGLIARRIVCYLSGGESVRAGERFGLIRFGSRVDVYLPHDVAPLVSVGQLAIAGETVIADLRAQETARSGEVR